MRSSSLISLVAILLIAAAAPAQPPDTLWTQTFGGSDDDQGYSVQQTSDGGYIIAGDTWSFGAGWDDVYLIKTDAAGNLVWQQIFGASGLDYGYSVQQTADGGYIIAGWTTSFGAGDWDVYLIKTDAAGNLVWQQTLGGSESDYGNSVQQTSDGGYIIAGETTSFGAFWADVYLIKTDPAGNLVWQQIFGASGLDYGYSVQQTSDGGYIIAGVTWSFGAGLADVYLIRLESDAVPVEPPDLESGDTPTNYCLHKAYPNPFNPSTTLSFTLPFPGLVKLEVFDVNGRAVGAHPERGHLRGGVRPPIVGFGESDLHYFPAGTHHVLFDGSDLPSGVYLARLSAGDWSAVQKLVLLK